MRKSDYKRKLNNALRNLGTYRKEFDMVIDKLADILCEYDEAAKIVKEEGRFCEHTNKSGATNQALTPAAQTLRQCRTDALPYMRELGLTPAGLKKLDVEKKEEANIMDALKAIG